MPHFNYPNAQPEEQPPSGFPKILPLLAIGCGLVAIGSATIGTVFEFPRFGWTIDGPAIGRFLYFLLTATIPFFLAQGLLLLANLKGKSKTWALLGLLATTAGSGFFFINLCYSNLFHYRYVDMDRVPWFDWNLGAIFWHGGALLLMLGTALLVIARLIQKNRTPAFLCIPPIILCFLFWIERIVTFQFNDPFGRLNEDFRILNKFLFLADNLLWMLVIVLCAIATMSSVKNPVSKKA